MSKQDQLLQFILKHDYIDTASIDNWGLQNQFTSAGRTSRRFAEQGLIRRMDIEEQRQKYPHIRKQRVWQVVKK